VTGATSVEPLAGFLVSSEVRAGPPSIALDSKHGIRAFSANS
jgi:hypothetical protein